MSPKLIDGQLSPPPQNANGSTSTIIVFSLDAMDKILRSTRFCTKDTDLKYTWKNKMIQYLTFFACFHLLC